MRAAATEEHAGRLQGVRVPIPDTDRKEIEQLYEAIRKGKARLVSPDGQARLLPDSLYSFLVELIGLLNAGKSVYIVQNQAKLTTIEAAAVLGVSRQFLVNLLKKEEVPYHMVGTHRRIYAQDLLRYKAKRDEHRHAVLRKLAQREAAEGLYDRIPAVLDED
ncbi:MAG: excisionase family DNA-binding protein [Bryobacteraceae bacterium]